MELTKKQKTIKILNIEKAYLTQSVEYRFCKPKVIGSTPIVGFVLRSPIGLRTIVRSALQRHGKPWCSNEVRR